MDQAFLIRLFIAIGVIWLTQVVLDFLTIKEPARKVIFGIVVLVGVIFLVAPIVTPLIIK